MSRLSGRAAIHYSQTYSKTARAPMYGSRTERMTRHMRPSIRQRPPCRSARMTRRLEGRLSRLNSSIWSREFCISMGAARSLQLPRGWLVPLTIGHHFAELGRLLGGGMSLVHGTAEQHDHPHDQKMSATAL